MPSIVEICNRALSHTGTDQTISNLEEKSKEAKLCARWYEASRDHLLANPVWNFGARRVVLALLDDPPSGWAYQYRYPADCVKLQAVYEPGGWTPSMQGHGLSLPTWEVASNSGGRVILTDIEQAEALYTARITDPNLFPPDFVTALELTLAANISMPLVNDRQLTTALIEQANAAMQSAVTASLNEAEEAGSPDASWILDRTGMTEDTYGSRGLGAPGPAGPAGAPGPPGPPGADGADGADGTQIHVGDTAPEDTTMLWLDTSAL